MRVVAWGGLPGFRAREEIVGKQVLAVVLMLAALACIGYTCYHVLTGELSLFEPNALVAYPFHAACMIVACMLMVPMRVPRSGAVRVLCKGVAA